MDVALVMTKADGTQRTFHLRKDRTVIGRTSSCDLRIPLSSVSRQHCEMTRAEGKVRLRDLGSSNGTYRNDTRITEVELEAGDRVTIGSVAFQVVIDGVPAIIEKLTDRAASPNDSASGRSGINRAPKASVTSSSMDDSAMGNIDTEVEAAITESGGDATPLEVEDPIAALEALAGSDFNNPGSDDSRTADADNDPADNPNRTHDPTDDDFLPAPKTLSQPKPQPRK